MSKPRETSLKSIPEERDARFRARVFGDPSQEETLIGHLSTNESDAETSAILDAFHFARDVDYDHAGLSSALYLVHPLRVANLVTSQAPATGPEGIIIALLHNCIEVAHVTPETITRRFGPLVGECIETLTVDRSRQWEPAYKDAFYRTIRVGSVAGQVVKVLDKVDNMFLLCMNPDDRARDRYLNEIHKHVRPMVSEVLLSLSDYFDRLYEDCRSLGHYPNPYADAM